jgi:hypothetical protein
MPHLTHALAAAALGAAGLLAAVTVYAETHRAPDQP